MAAATATKILSRIVPKTLTPFISRSISSSYSSLLRRLRPLSAASPSLRYLLLPPSSPTLRLFSTEGATKESKCVDVDTILLDGCDFKHWIVFMEKPEGNPTRDEIIDYYIKTLAQVVGSEEEARKKIYSVSTRHYYAFGAEISERESEYFRLNEVSNVRWVLPDSYLNVKEKNYGGEPFINGQAVPYDPKYHEEWVKNNARENERNKRKDRPLNADKSRNPSMQGRPGHGGPPGKRNAA